MVDILVNPTVISINQFEVGTQPTYQHMITDFVNQFQQEMIDANIKFIRLMGWLVNNHNPVTSWDGADWVWRSDYVNELYQVLQAIENIGAETIICILNNPTHNNRWPANMPVQSNGLPQVTPYAEMCRQWAQKCVDGGFRPIYWQVMNEIFQWVTWTTDWTDRHDKFCDLFIASRAAIKEVIPEAKVSFDFCAYKFFLQGIMANKPNVVLDFLDFHRYDHDQAPENITDATLIRKADEHMFVTGGYMNWTVAEMRQAFIDHYGVNPEILITECNANAWQDGSRVDVRNANIIGAIRSALTFRQCVLNDVITHIHFTMSGNRNFHQGSRPPNDPDYGVGFGLLDTTGTKWPTYQIHKMFGNSIDVADQILSVDVSSTDVRALAWKHEGKSKLMLINKNPDPQLVNLNGLSRPTEYEMIDSSLYIADMVAKTGEVSEQIELGGYGIAILSEKIDGGEEMVTYENVEPGTQRIQIGKDETTVTFVARTTVDIPPGETRELELLPGERLRGTPIST